MPLFGEGLESRQTRKGVRDGGRHAGRSPGSGLEPATQWPYKWYALGPLGHQAPHTVCIEKIKK